MLICYVREKPGKPDTKGRPIGVVIALDPKRIGWSFCHRKDRNKFSKKRAKEIALKRAEKKDLSEYKSIPREIVPVIEKIKDLCKKYFK